MRSFCVISALMLLMMFTSCTQNNPELTSPVEPQLLGDSRGYDAECHDNMCTIASQECIYFAINGTYTSSLAELELEGIVCPECGNPYILQVGEGDYCYIECPLPQFPNHGNIHDFVVSWPPDPEDNQNICRGNMITIASMCVIFYAEHDRYPQSLEELGAASYICPECADEYIYYTYNEGVSFFIGCAMLPEPGHGYIDDGGASWGPGSGPFQSECRAIMRTIASQEVIYFAYNGKYTESLEDLEMEGIVCPQCGEPHILLVTGEGDEFFVGCPIEGWACHGFIDNGVASWHDTE